MLLTKAREANILRRFIHSNMTEGDRDVVTCLYFLKSKAYSLSVGGSFAFLDSEASEMEIRLDKLIRMAEIVTNDSTIRRKETIEGLIEDHIEDLEGYLEAFYFAMSRAKLERVALYGIQHNPVRKMLWKVLLLAVRLRGYNFKKLLN